MQKRLRDLVRGERFSRQSDGRQKFLPFEVLVPWPGLEGTDLKPHVIVSHGYANEVPRHVGVYEWGGGFVHVADSPVSEEVIHDVWVEGEVVIVRVPSHVQDEGGDDY